MNKIKQKSVFRWNINFASTHKRWHRKSIEIAVVGIFAGMAPYLLLWKSYKCFFKEAEILVSI